MPVREASRKMQGKITQKILFRYSNYNEHINKVKNFSFLTLFAHLGIGLLKKDSLMLKSLHTEII